ncbi:MAG: glycosyltransferase family 4 protein [Verrucomicrobia subdivision 3 bacterium]|nr:glycosyltransferase family 4 protein [Limisphaerales bacterium]
MRDAVRVLWVSDSPLTGSGFARVTREITTRLAKMPGLQIACVGWNHDGWPYERARFPLIVFPSRDCSDTTSFERAFRDFKPQVVITLGEIWMVDWLQRHPLRPQFKWIGYFPVDGRPFYPPWEPLLKDVDELVTMSEFGRQVFQSGLPSRKIHMIYHGVDTETFHPLADRDRLKSHERFRGKFVVGCVARNQPRKNIPALVKAVAQLCGKINNLHLYLHMNPCDVGYDIVTLLHRYRLEGRADVSGPEFNMHQPLEDEQLNRLYNIFDVMALPSVAEGFGLPILESFAAGVPVVATDYSACSELVRGRGELVRILTTVCAGTNLIEHAVLDVADLAARIEKLYHNPKLANQYAQEGLEFARELTWDGLMPKWLALIATTAGVDVRR